MRQTLFVLFTILTFGLSAQSIVNNSLSFDGIDDHLVVEGSPDIATIDHPADISYTLEAWIKLDAETNETIMSMGTGNEGNYPELNESIFIFNVSKNLLGVNLGSQTYTAWGYSTDAPIIAGHWTHVAVSISAEGGGNHTVKFYVNGAPKGSLQYPINVFPLAERLPQYPLYIGRQGLDCNCNFFDGLMDEVRVWNDVRTPEEIATYYNKELTGTEDNLEIYYNFNEGTGNVATDQSSNSFDATFVNGASWSSENSTPVFDNYVDFDGVSQSARVTGFTDEDSNELSIEAWIKIDVSAGPVNATIVEFGDDLPSLFLSNEHLFLRLGPDNLIGHDFSPYIGEMTHVAATLVEGSQKLYINGVEVAYSYAGPGSAPYEGVGFNAVGDNFGIGNNGTDAFFNGKIAEVRIWNDIRTPEELELNLRRTLFGTEPNLVAYYDFSEGEGTTLYDKTENNFDAIFYDGDLPTTKPVSWTTNPEAEFPNFPEESHIYFEENSISAYDIKAFLDNGASNEGIFYNRFVEDDGAYFAINFADKFIMYDPLDYENPQDANGNNVYEVTVIATSLDSRSISYKDYFVHITNAPTIFVNTDVVDVLENTDGTILDVDARDEGMANDLGLFYSLSGTDAAIFSIDEDNGELSFISRPDFENPLDDNWDNVYELIVQANTSSAVVDQIVTITVTDSDTEIAVSYSPLNEIFENAAAGQLVGAFSFDPESSPDDLVITEGAEFFEIVNGQLFTTVVFDYETATNYTVTVDYPNIETYTSIDVAISNVVEPPTSISLSNASILENEPAGSVVGTINYSGGDGAGDNSLLSLPDGIFDNHEFAIDGNQLVSTRPYDKESDGIILIRISYDGLINLNKDIIIDNVNEGPYNFTFTPETVLENEENALVGELEASGDIAGLLRYEISDNELLDNALFYIAGNDVRSVALDYELKSQYQFEAIVYDEEEMFKKEIFTVDVTDVDEAELTLSVAGQTIDYDGSHDFGSIVLNQPSQTKTFQIENTGVIDLTLTDSPFIEITGSGASQFTIDETGMASNLAPGATTTFTVTYIPTTPGVSEAQLQIANGTLIDPFIWSVEGIGLDITTSGNWKLVGGIPGKFSQDGGIGSVVYNGELYTSSVSAEGSQQGIFKLVGEDLVYYGNANRQPYLYASSGGTFFTAAKQAGGNVIRSIVDYGGGSIFSGYQFNVPSQPTGVGTSYKSEFTMGFDNQDNSFVVYAANFAEPAAFNAATGGVYIKKFVQNGSGSEDYAQLPTQSLKPYGGNQNIYSYDIAFDGSDNLWVVSRADVYDLFLSKYNDATDTWTHYDLTSQLVNSNYLSTGLKMEIDDSDNIHIVDKQNYNAKIEYLKVAPDGSVLIADEYTTTTGYYDNRFSFALGTDQNPIIVFQDNATSKLRAIKYENGAFVNFRGTYVTNDKAVSGDTPFKLSVNPISGVAYIVYKSSTFLGMSIVATEEIVPELTFSVGDKVATDDEPVVLQSGVGYEKSIVLTIANNGQAIVNFTGDPRANLAGDTSDDLEIDLGEFPASLFPGESVDVSITFTPQDTYDNFVTLSFPSNATGTGSDVQMQLLGLDNTNTGQWEQYAYVNSSQINSIDMSLKNGKPIWALNTVKYLGGFPNPLRNNQLESLYQLELKVYDTHIDGNVDPIAWTNYYGSSTLSEGAATSWDPLFLDIFDNIRIAEDPSYGVTTISSSGISDGLRSFALKPDGDFAQIPRNDKVGDLLYDRDGSFFNLQVSTNQVKLKRLSDNTIFVNISGLTNADTDASLVTYEEDLFFAYGDLNTLVVNRVAKDASYNNGITTLLTETDVRFQQADETRTKDLEISKDGQLYLAYIQHSTGNVQLKSYDLLVESWTDLPQLDLSTVLANASSIQDIQLQIHPDGTPYLSIFYDNDDFLGGNGYAKAFQFKNNEWTELGGTKISPYTGREVTDTSLGATVQTNLSTIRKSVLQINEDGILYWMTADKIYTLTPEPSAFDHEPSITSTPSSVSVEESSVYNYAIVAEDEDASDVLTLTTSELPDWLTFVDNGDRTATLAGTPADGDVGDHSITLNVNDGRLQRTQTVVIEVTDINTQPEFTLPSETLELSENAVEQIISITDIFDGDEFLDQDLTFSITSSNENLVNDHSITYVDGVTGSITFTPLPTRTGLTTLTIRLEDDGDPLLSLEKTIEVTVVPQDIDGAIVVTTLDDAGAGSLRQAMIDANASPEDDIIDLRQVTGSIELQSSLPKITSNIVFEGSEPGALSVSGASQYQVFFIESGNVTMQAFSIINGRSAGGNGGSGDGGGGGGAGFGGAVFLDNGNLVIDRMAFTGNVAQGGAGANSSGVTGGTGGSSLFGNGGTGGSAPFGQPGGNGGNGPVFGAGGGGGGQGSSVFVGGRGGSGNFGGGSGGGGGSSSGDGGNRGTAGAFGGLGGAAKLGGGGGGGAGLGGAIFARSGSVIINASSFSSNSASRGSAGSNSGTNQTYQPSAGQGKGGAVFINDDVSFSRSNNTFSSNTASDHSGMEGTDDANIYSESSAEATFTLLSRTDMDENQSGPNVRVATVSVFTGNPLDDVSFSLVSGFGDNNAFVLVENELQLNDGVTLDFETKASYSIKIETSINSAITEQEFTLTVNDLNEAATDFTLSNLSIDEGQSVGTVIGTFSATDEDLTNTHIYSLVSGFGDNASFQIVGDDLQVAEVFDFDDKSSYSIQVELDDSGLSLTRDFTITVNNINVAPTAITLSNSSIPENSYDDFLIGSLSAVDSDDDDTHTFGFTGVAGLETADFKLINGDLYTNRNFDFETESSLQVEIYARDNNAESVDQILTITITDANDVPTGLTISSSEVEEAQPAGTEIGLLSALDPDAGDTHTYTLVSGFDQNYAVDIVGNSLQTAIELDFDVLPVLDLKINVNDGNGGINEFELTIDVIDANQAPTAIILSNDNIDENVAVGSVVGTLSTTDPDIEDTHTYEVTSSIEIDGETVFPFVTDGANLITNMELNFESMSAFFVNVQTTDAEGLTYLETLTIDVNDVNEAPTAIYLSANTIAENIAAGTTIGQLVAEDPDANDLLTYALVSGTGDEGNAFFQIGGTDENEIENTVILDFEEQASYSVRVRVIDAVGLFLEQVYTIEVTDSNDAPTGIDLPGGEHFENTPIGTTVGSFSAVDQDVDDTHTFTFHPNYPDNDFFTIDGADLKVGANIDYESTPTLTIGVVVNDANGGISFTEEFEIAIANTNEAPTDILLSNSSFDENSEMGVIIGAFSTIDPDIGNSFIYTVNTSTIVDGTVTFDVFAEDGFLKVGAATDFETTPVIIVEVESHDHEGLSFVKTFEITINDVNEAPTSMTLNANIIAENTAVGVRIGQLIGIDPDFDSPLNYTLVEGEGDEGNTSFQIGGPGNELENAVILDFETQSSYSVRVRVTDPDGLFFEQAYSIEVIDTNDGPAGIELSSQEITENADEGTVVGILTAIDQDAIDEHTFTLHLNYPDKQFFAVDGNELKVGANIDFESTQTLTIGVVVNDTDGGNSFTKEFEISVTDTNDAPTAITLSNDNIDEDAEVGSVIGVLSTDDPDAGDEHTYEVLTPFIFEGQSYFPIIANGSDLVTTVPMDYEQFPLFEIEVKSTDAEGLSLTQTFTLRANDINEAPTSMTLNANTIAENTAVGVRIGQLTGTDPDFDHPLTYTLAAGEGDEGNASFQIGGPGNELENAVILDYETQSIYSVRVRVTDPNGLFFEQVYTIEVIDNNDGPTGIELSSQEIVENANVGTVVGSFTAIDQDMGDTHTFVINDNYPDTQFFTIDGSELKVEANIDFESTQTLLIGVIVNDDNGGNSFTKEIEISVTDINDAPTAISLSRSDIDEDAAAGSVIGVLTTTDQDANDTHTYEVLTSIVIDGNTYFPIVADGANLITTVPMDFEEFPIFVIDVKSTDEAGLSYTETFTLTANDVNEAPTAVMLSANTINENVSIGTVIGSLSTVDEDVNDTHSYSLIDGFEDNQDFSISGSNLMSNAVFDFETKNFYTIKVKADDGAGGVFEQEFSIDVLNVSEGATQTIIFEALPAKTFGDAPFELTATASSGLGISYTSSDEAIVSISGSTATILAGGEVTITATQLGVEGSFLPANPVSQTLTVNKAPQTITFDEIADQVLGADPITLNATASSSLAITYSATGPASLEGNELTITGVGEIQVTASQVGNGNYLSASITRAFVVTDPAKTDQVITFNAPTSVYINETPIILEASSDSGLGIEFEIISGNDLANLSGDNLNLTQIGIVEIAARQVGNNDFNAAVAIATIEIKPVFTVSGSIIDEFGNAFNAGVFGAFRVEDGIVHTANLSDGAYSLELKDGSYYLAVGPTDQAAYYTTFYGNEIFWEKATLVTVSSDMSGLDIQMVAQPSDDLLTGNGSVTGRVLDGGNGGGRIERGRIMDGDPIEGVSIFLIRISDEQIMTEVISDVNGDFQINGIPEGEYRLQVEVTGVAMDLGNATISVDAEGTPIELTALVGENGIVLEEVITSLDELFTSSVTIYPNPFDNQLNFKMENELLGQIKLQLFTMDGRLLYINAYEKNSLEYTFQLNDLSIPSGIVILRLIHEDAVATYKLIKN